MKKIWIPIGIFSVIIAGGLWYNSYINEKTDEMLGLTDMAYMASISDFERCENILNEIDGKLDKISGLLCAFLDRDIINEAEDAIVYAMGLADAESIDCRGGISAIKEKISHIKNSAQIKLKYIL